MLSWELHVQFVPTEPKSAGGFFSQEMRTGHFWESEAGKAAFREAQARAAEGWELESAHSRTKGSPFGAAGMGGIVSGYVLFFKRPVDV